jgi:transcriptional regulator with XRE-family HTH domain
MKTFAEIYESMKDTLEYQVAELSLAFTESILLRMEELDGLSRKELAERMGATKPYVTKLLKGESNFTFETLVKLAQALECRIEPPALVPNEKRAPTAQVIQFARRPQLAIPFSPRSASITETIAVTEHVNDNTDEAAAA